MSVTLKGSKIFPPITIASPVTELQALFLRLLHTHDVELSAGQILVVPRYAFFPKLVPLRLKNNVYYNRLSMDNDDHYYLFDVPGGVALDITVLSNELPEKPK